MDRNRSSRLACRLTRRDLARIAGGGLALLATSSVAARGRTGRQRPGQRKPKFRTVTRTFSNVNEIVILDRTMASPYPSEITVGGFKRGKVLDVNVTLTRLSHGYLADIDALLVGPNGGAALIMSDVGENVAATRITLTLDDQADRNLPQSTSVGSGRFKPTNFGDLVDPFPAPAPGGIGQVRLATFKGIDPNGVWQLFVVDDNIEDAGVMAGGWSLKITARLRR